MAKKTEESTPSALPVTPETPAPADAPLPEPVSAEAVPLSQRRRSRRRPRNHVPIIPPPQG